MSHQNVTYSGNKITDKNDFPYDWYSKENWFGPRFCVRYRKFEMLQPPEKIISQDPYRVIPFGPSVKEGKVTVEASLQWTSSSSVTSTTSLELGLKAMSTSNEASATFKNETSTTRTLGQTQTATFRTEYTIGPRHLVEVFVDKWKVKTRYHITSWKRQGAVTLHFTGLPNPWHGSGFMNFSGDESVTDCEYTLDSWPRIIALPIGDMDGFVEMNEKQRSFAFKFNWMRFAKNVIENYFGADQVAKLKPGKVEGVVVWYYDESKPARVWSDFYSDLQRLL